jgi:hypothetical protein
MRRCSMSEILDMPESWLWHLIGSVLPGVVA